jgi:hypothetical protein
LSILCLKSIADYKFQKHYIWEDLKYIISPFCKSLHHFWTHFEHTRRTQIPSPLIRNRSGFHVKFFIIRLSNCRHRLGCRESSPTLYSIILLKMRPISKGDYPARYCISSKWIAFLSLISLFAMIFPFQWLLCPNRISQLADN